MPRTDIDFSTTSLADVYGSNSFNDRTLRSRLPEAVYLELKRVQRGEAEMTLETAEEVAAAMRDWALERGATHFTHWFQPLTGLTAEKHDAFIIPAPDGQVLVELSGRALIKGEPDASSFPSGGLRATFEARGYTAWDVTSPAFLKEDSSGITLYIPTAFVAYTGEALDKKVPLLRSMAAINRAAVRVLRALGNSVSSQVSPIVGPEQEYFLVDKEYFNHRTDLLLTGRTLFGAPAPKGQEMEDHYCGTIKERVAGFMRELNLELWKVGVAAKTQHNEVAPNQFEIAILHGSANVISDANQLVMDSLKRVALRHGLVALLHEKPFQGLNGSGKHTNWSLMTDDGINLLDPGSSPQDNIQFLVFLLAVIGAVDRYASILRMSIANAGNDHRLGGHEAPPTVVSIFLGEPLTELLDKISQGLPVLSEKEESLEIGVPSLPRLPRDLTDRNRTAPLAFTGTKFEFRMVPSSESLAGPIVALNTAVAQVLEEFAVVLEKEGTRAAGLRKVLAETWHRHRRIVFNGNGYSKEWLLEAERRGLPNIQATVDALPEIIKPYAIDLFERQGVLSKDELESRCAIYLDRYAKQVNLEARTMITMANREIFPAVGRYITEISGSINAVKSLSTAHDAAPLESLLKELLDHLKELRERTKDLDLLVAEALEIDDDVYRYAKFFRQRIAPKMTELRLFADKLETLVPKNLWPLPTYEDLLFRL